MMKTVAKRIIKVVSFIVIFILLFYACQHVLHYRWSGVEDISTRYIDFERQPENSLDVLYFGTSEMYEGVAPIITYESEGITGYNLAVTYTSAVTNYYQLLYALKHQTPKIVACDFASLFKDNTPADSEAIYRKIYETMPDKEIKDQLLDDIMELDPSQDYWSWRLPFFRYHSSWNEVTIGSFFPETKYEDDYELYSKGALLNSKSFEGDIYKITPDLWNSEKSDEPLSDISVKYYDKFIEECQSRGIKVLAVIPPKIYYASEFSSQWDTMKAYFDSRSVDYLNYNTYDQVSRMELNFEDHYFDTAHLNTLGAFVFSKTLAADLKEKYALTSHKNDSELDPYWKDTFEVLKEEIPAEQPDFRKCLQAISELDMDTLIYVNDKSALNYEKYSEPLARLGVDFGIVKETGCVFIKYDDSKVSYNRVSDVGKMNIRIRNDEESSVLCIDEAEAMTITALELEDIDLFVVALDDQIIKSVIKF